MEKRISYKIDSFVDDFKNDIIKKVRDSEVNVDEICKYIDDYVCLTLEKIDFTKRKRVKSVVPYYLRCTAKRANGEQCTRKKKEGNDYCGTHEKNRPHGIIEPSTDKEEKLTKLEVWIQDINGIIYYIDGFNNVYKTDDIMGNKINPKIIAKYSIEDGKYKILSN